MMSPGDHLLTSWKADHFPIALRYPQFVIQVTKGTIIHSFEKQLLLIFFISKIFHEKKGHRIAMLDLIEEDPE